MSPITIKCRTGIHQLRLRQDRFWKRTVCPKCKEAADPLRIRRLTARIKGLLFHRRRHEIPDEIRYANLRWRIDKLIDAAWRNNESKVALNLNTTSVANISVEDAIKLFLNHVRLVAPGFNVPVHIPRVKRERLASEAGKFVEADGFVSIALSEELLTNSKALRSILAHEVCHYVLNNSGIRESDTENNEKLTDLCMFVSGLGEIFVDGYKTENAKEEYRVGHRLGYLSDSEYQFARRCIKRKRESFRPNELDSLRQKIKARVTDAKVMDRLLTDQRKRFPERNEVELYQGVLETLNKR